MSFEPPIQNSEAIDIVGQRRDGGVDLIIVVSGHLDGSPSTLSLLENKIKRYIAELTSSEFKKKFHRSANRSNSILVVSEYVIDRHALDVIERLRPIAQASGATLEIRRSME
jgi:hypothetical protein